MPRVFLLLLCLCLAACGGYPRDAHDSSDRARESLRVGLSHDPPWIIATDGAPRGTEVDLINAFAQARQLRVDWVIDGHDALMEDLLDHRLHLVAGGHIEQSNWTEAGWSRSFMIDDARGRPTERRIALPPGENAWHLAFDRFLHARERQR